MNVYIIEITKSGKKGGPTYDVYDSHMVVADNEEEAKSKCPMAGEWEWGDDKILVWIDKKLSTCRLVQKDDIVASFNAG